MVSHVDRLSSWLTEPANANQDLEDVDGPRMNEFLDRLCDRWLLQDKILMA